MFTKIIITKIELLKTCNNDMQFCRYYLVHFRAYKNDNKYIKGKFVMQVDIQDIQEFYEKDTITIQEWNMFKYECAYNILEYYTTTNIKELYDYCNKTIQDWNSKEV